MAIQVDPTNLADSAADDASQEMYINTSAKTLKVVAVGGIVDTGQQSENGVSIKCVYSFLKEQWTTDPNTKNLAAFPFPMVPITDEFFELVDGWTWANTTTEGLLRNGGWLVRNTSGNVIEHWAGIKTTGSTEADDQLYYQLIGTSGTAAAADFVDVGAVNQGVQVIDDPNGDGSYVDGFSYCDNIKVYNRQYNQIYSISSTSANGEASLTAPKLFGLDASTTTDLNIEDADGQMAVSPYDEIKIRYFSGAFTRDVDSGTGRNFGIVIDVKTHSGIDGSAPGGASVLTTAAGGMTIDAFIGGTLKIHEGTDEGTVFSITDNDATTITVSGTIAVGSNLSFTAYPATASTATAEQIYTRVQYDLRQNSDIDATGGTVTGKTANQLLTFVGSDLKAGALTPTNPNGGGSGVLIEGFKASDTNRITFYDNTAAGRTYPYVASLTINFGDNLKNDASAEYWVYFTNDDAGDNLGYDWGTANAIIVDDNSGTDMAGLVSGVSSVEKSFNYDGNVQRGAASAGDDAPIPVIGIGLATGQYVKTTGTIQRSTSNVVSLIAALERNYSNPA